MKATKMIKQGELLFFPTYGRFLVVDILSTTFYYKFYSGIPHKVIIVAVLLLLIYKELWENQLTRSSLFSFSVSVGLFLLVNHVGSVSVAAIFVLIWSLRNIDFKSQPVYAVQTILLIGLRGGANRCFG